MPDKEAILLEVKSMLGFSADTDSDRDERIEAIINNATARLKVLLGGTDPPEGMQYIITEVAVKRFNRIGSEGMSSHNVEGEAIAFSDNDFDEFRDDISAFLETQNEGRRGKLRFL